MNDTDRGWPKPPPRHSWPSWLVWLVVALMVVAVSLAVTEISDLLEACCSS